MILCLVIVIMHVFCLSHLWPQCLNNYLIMGSPYENETHFSSDTSYDNLNKIGKIKLHKMFLLVISWFYDVFCELLN